MKCTVSIIVPIYNASTYLRDCLDSVLRQTYTVWTCYLVNDGSTDDSQSIIDEFCQIDKRFVGLKKQNEGSPDRTVQFGIDHSDSEFVICIGDDDIMSDDYIEKMLKRQSESNADMVIPYMYCFNNDISNVLWKKPTDEQFDHKQVMNGKDACLLTIPDWVVGMNGNMVRRDVIKMTQVGIWSYSDELREREMLVKCKIVAFSDAQYLYRYNPKSLTKSVSPKMFEKSIIEAQLVQFAKKYYPRNYALISNLAKKHFSGLQNNIVYFNSNRNKFTNDEIKHIENVLEQSYYLTDVGEILKIGVKWGALILLLRRFSWYQKFVINHFSK